MVQKYTISELAGLLNVSYNTAKKKVTKKGYKTVKEEVNNRSTTVVMLSNDQLNDLIENTEVNKQKYFASNNSSMSIQEEVIEGEKVEPETHSSQTELLQFFREFNAQLNEQYEKRLKSEKQLYLLEDKTRVHEQEINIYKEELNKLRAENKMLMEKQKEIEAELKQSFLTMPMSELLKKI